jgi:hypothetical protein
MPQRLPLGDISDWVTPVRALKSLEPLGESYLRVHTLLERLKGGMVRAVAETTVWQDDNSRASKLSLEASDWAFVSESDVVWKTGDLTTTYFHDRGRRTVRHFNIRLHPFDIQQILPSEAGAAPVESPVSGSIRGPSVSEAHLAEWYALYRKAYTGHLDTEANALRSAQGMFPGKSVSREAVRKLRGAQKPGPKGPRNLDR